MADDALAGAGTLGMSSSSEFGSPIGGEYKAIQTRELAQKILHMRGIVAYIAGKASELQNDTSPNFEVIVSSNPEYFRPRAYVKPANSNGIREELSQAVLLKAALAMSGR